MTSVYVARERKLVARVEPENVAVRSADAGVSIAAHDEDAVRLGPPPNASLRSRGGRARPDALRLVAALFCSRLPICRSTRSGRGERTLEAFDGALQEELSQLDLDSECIPNAAEHLDRTQ